MDYCLAYCSHGGTCTREPGHEDLHDSGYCQWADAESLTRDAADAVLRSRGPDGVMIADQWDLMVPREIDD